ncbi:hypothetical protein, conserved [Eimeria tenella]|uniref:Uncharacterized protein n=1 Tax=Eimeria tenella TaxID=5802 RepID=U6KKA9_EIMTE|nr:hypothetical protein, conserved [Eimeria tenella]CDJ38334.1 hypothetical protein, conserved [Eimeria tenella]|eukprot:XP_013229172.1 hypothetical protein, conserved [Eimeria tenella]
MQSIQKLQSGAGQRLRSQYLYSSFRRVVAKLVESAFASSCSRVEIFVNFSNFELRVCDNGKGVGAAELEAIRSAWLAQSSLSEGTSSAAELALLAHVGDLQIVSREAGKPETLQLALPLPATVAACSPRSSCGTSVSLLNFFKGSPVRRLALNAKREAELLQQFAVAAAV